jgi:hypothetical protein
MARIAKKTLKQINNLILDVINLNNVEEFDVSFNSPPEFWTDREKAICDYQGRVMNELMSGIRNIFNMEEA